ncbi:MAG: EamA family transporter [Rhizobiales bacterium]|nr:EamA family transporter [Hyphomicrobiales bacterium]
MSLEVFFAVLAAAVMHAAWNAMIKQRLDRFLSISLMSFSMGLLSLVCLPFVAVPQGFTWFWIILSALLHTGYKIYLIRAYDSGDLAQIYPLARGAAPLITALAGVVLLSEVLSPMMAGGIVVLCLGIGLMAARGGAQFERLSGLAIANALVTSLFIAGYTLTDGIGGRTAPTASSYAVWMFAIDGFWMALFCMMMRGRQAFISVLPEWRSGLATGALSLGAYWIVIWAMTKAPIAAVAALRETSILFAVLISVIFLKERLTRWRSLACVLIVAGVVALRLG